MKMMIVTILLLLSASMFSQNRYELIDEGKNREFLSDTISKMAVQDIITDKPFTVIDGQPFRYQDLESEKLKLYQAEIVSIISLDKQKSTSVFGKFGEAVLL